MKEKSKDYGGVGQSCGEGRAVGKGFLSENLWKYHCCEEVGEEGKVVQDNREL